MYTRDEMEKWAGSVVATGVPLGRLKALSALSLEDRLRELADFAHGAKDAETERTAHTLIDNLRLAGQYATKYVVDGGDRNDPSDANLHAILDHCALPAKEQFFPLIREELRLID